MQLNVLQGFIQMLAPHVITLVSNVILYVANVHQQLTVQAVYLEIISKEQIVFKAVILDNINPLHLQDNAEVNVYLAI